MRAFHLISFLFIPHWFFMDDLFELLDLKLHKNKLKHLFQRHNNHQSLRIKNDLGSNRSCYVLTWTGLWNISVKALDQSQMIWFLLDEKWEFPISWVNRQGLSRSTKQQIESQIIKLTKIKIHWKNTKRVCVLDFFFPKFFSIFR